MSCRVSHDLSLSVDDLPPPLLACYLDLLGLLLSHTPRKGHVMSGDWTDPEDDDYLIDDEPDPLGSREELSVCCVAIILGEQLPNRIKRAR